MIIDASSYPSFVMTITSHCGSRLLYCLGNEMIFLGVAVVFYFKSFFSLLKLLLLPLIGSECVKIFGGAGKELAAV